MLTLAFAVAAKAQLEAQQTQQTLDATQDIAFIRFLAADLLSRRRDADALASLTRLTQLAPDDANAWVERGMTAARLKQWGEAATAHERAAAIAGKQQHPSRVDVWRDCVYI